VHDPKKSFGMKLSEILFPAFQRPANAWTPSGVGGGGGGVEAAKKGGKKKKGGLGV